MLPGKITHRAEQNTKTVYYDTLLPCHTRCVKNAEGKWDCNFVGSSANGSCPCSVTSRPLPTVIGRASAVVTTPPSAPRPPSSRLCPSPWSGRGGDGCYLCNISKLCKLVLFFHSGSSSFRGGIGYPMRPISIIALPRNLIRRVCKRHTRDTTVTFHFDHGRWSWIHYLPIVAIAVFSPGVEACNSHSTANWRLSRGLRLMLNLVHFRAIKVFFQTLLGMLKRSKFSF